MPENEQSQPQPQHPEASQGQSSTENQSETLKQRFSQKLKELKEKATNIVQGRKEAHEKKPEKEQEEPRKAVQEAMANPKHYNVEQVFQQSEILPKDTDVQLVLEDMISQARDNENFLDDPSNLNKLSQWIMELQTIETDAQKTTESKQEAHRYKRKIINQYAEVVVQDIVNKESLTSVQADERKQVAKEWAEDVGDELPPEALREQVTKNKRKKQAKKDQETTSKAKILYDELTGDEYTNLPDEVKRVVEQQRTYAEREDHEAIIRNIQDWEDAISGASMDQGLKMRMLDSLQHFKKEFAQQLPESIEETIKEYKAACKESNKKVQSLETELQQLQATDEEMRNETRDKRLDRIRSETKTTKSYTSKDNYGLENQDLTPEAIQKYKEEIDSMLTNGSLGSEDKQLAQTLLDHLDARLEDYEANKRYNEARAQQLSLGGDKFTERSPIRQFLQSAEDVDFLSSSLANPDGALYYIRNNDFDAFQKQVLRVYNQIFISADVSTDQPFENVFTSFHHAPAADEVSRLVDNVITRAHANGRGDAELITKLNKLKNKLSEERATRSYSHNVSYIISTRGSLEDLAGFSRRFRSSQLTAAFEEEMVRTAARLFEVKVNQTLANSNWTIPTEFMQIDPELGEIRVDKETMDQLRLHYPDAQEWEITRAYRLARGLHLGASGVVLDRLGEADPPGSTETGSFASYFGEKILSGWNPFRHIFHRFGIPPELADLVYTTVDSGATGSTWNHKEMERVMKDIQGLRGSKKVEYIAKMTGTPLIEVRNPFGVGSIMSRGGWRFEKATLHLLAPKTPGTEVNIGTGTSKDVRKDQVDWAVTWKRAKRVGPEIMKFFIGTYGDHIADAMGTSKEELHKDVFRHIQKINPLKFAHWEKEELYDSELYQNSIRGRALKEVYGSDANDFMKVRDDAAVLEDRLALVQSAALERAWKAEDKASGTVEEGHWGIQEEDWEILRNDSSITDKEIEQVQKYKDALDRAINTKKFRRIVTPNSFDRKGGTDAHGDKKDPVKPINEEVDAITYFATRDTNKLTMGTEDLDYSKLDFERAGQFIVERAFSDANHLSQAGNAMAGMPDTLISANAKRELEPLLEMLHTVHKPMEDYHGPDAASDAVRKMATVAIRFYDTDGWTHFMPQPIQGMVRLFKESSRAKERLGKTAWEWTSNEKFAFIDALQAHGLLTEKDLKKLRAEVGADKKMLVVDYATMAAPLILALILWQAFSEALKEEN